MILRHALAPADNTRLAHLCGSLDEHLRQIEHALGVRVTRRDDEFRIEGPKAAAERTRQLLDSLYERARRVIPPETFQLALVEAAGDLGAAIRRKAEAALAPAPAADALTLRTRRADLSARTPRQHEYLHKILSHDITFGLGPAGTGKTFLAVACAVDALELSLIHI